jgi:hypothetical protein
LDDVLRRFTALLLRESNVDAPPTHAGCWYAECGDGLFYYEEDVAYYMDRVNAALTLYRAESDGRVIGFHLTDLTRTLHGLVRLMQAEIQA